MFEKGLNDWAEIRRKIQYMQEKIKKKNGSI